jgi:hypothetical protein
LSCIKRLSRPLGNVETLKSPEDHMKRNRFTPWLIGLAIIAVADGVLLLLTDEGQAELAQQTALVVIPVVGLALMYLMFKSQE